MKLSHYQWDPEKDLIAEGGFAEVFKAKDINTSNRWVALKIYKEAVSRGTSASTGQKKYSLEQEFAKIDGLSHTNIISFYGLEYIQHTDAMGRTANYPVLIMEYAGEGTLKELSLKNISDENLEEIITSIIRATGYLHSQGVIHRDLKPGNVLFSKDRNGKLIVKITDFGISKDILGEKSIDQSFTEGVGTPHYMAPEQFFKKKFGLNGEVSERTDFWAVGVILYQLLTGKRPFGEGIKDYELIREEITQKKIDLSAIPEKYKRLIEKCLEKDANKRVASANELLQLLKPEPAFDPELTIIPGEKTTILGDEGTIINPPQPPTPTTPPKKKSFKYVLAAIVVIACSFGGFKWYQNYKMNEFLDKGWENYKAGNFKEAYENYRDASNYNSGKAYYHLGLMKNYGRGTTKDYKKGLEYIDKAIDLNYNLAFNLKANAYLEGFGVPIDSTKSLEYNKKAYQSAKKLINKNDVQAYSTYSYLLIDKELGILDTLNSYKYSQKASDLGHLWGRNIQAWFYKNGFIVEKDCNKAIELYKMGLAINHDKSIRLLADMYYSDYDCSDSIQDYKKALKYYKIAANLNNSIAQRSVGYMYKYGQGVEKDLDEALVWYSKAADDDYVIAMNDIGTIYENKKKIDKARGWYLKAAKKDNKYGMYNLGDIYSKEENKSLYNLDSANYWYKKAAKLGHSGSQVNIGYNYSKGTGLEKNVDSAFYWYKKAALQKYYLGEYNLGIMYKNGYGCEQDYTKAKEWFEKSANQGYSNAYYSLGRLYYNGNGVDKDYTKAKEWYEKAAEKGDKDAYNNLGIMYYNGEGGKKNYYKAREYYKKAAELGVANAQYMYAYLNENGRGGSRNYYTARKWYNKAVKQGYINAKTNLALLYLRGRGGSTNERLSFKLTKEAANSGSLTAQHNLGLHYYYGWGVEKSRSNARYWLDKSCNKGYKRSCTKINELFSSGGSGLYSVESSK